MKMINFPDTGPKGFPDAAYIEAVKNGGAEMERMTKELIRHFNGYPWKFKRLFNLDKDVAIDAYTDAVMELIRRIRVGSFDPRYRISTCLYRITYNRCIDQLRKIGRGKRLEELAIPEVAGTGERSPLYEMLLTEAFDGLMNMMNSLRDKCREILMKWGYWGYSMEEVAQLVGSKNAETARQEKSRCLKSLKAAIDKEHHYPFPTID